MEAIVAELIAPTLAMFPSSGPSDIRPLFIGNFLSRTRGTIGPTEWMAGRMRQQGWSVKTASSFEFKLFRALHMITACLFTRCNVVCADVFTGNIRNILPVICFLTRLRRKPLVLILHGGQLPELFRQRPQTVQRVLKQADLLVTPSPHLRHFFSEKGFEPVLMPNFIDLNRFPYAEPQQLPAPKLLWIRAFSKVYNPLLAIEILEKVQKQYPAATLTMIGPDGGLLKEVRMKIREKNLESAVRITGPVANEKLPEYHHSHTVLLNTTSFESFGVAILEAAASGIPVVSSRVGSLPEIWENGAEILLVSSWEPADFAAEIYRLTENPAWARALSTNARKKAERYHLDELVPRWQRLFHGILER